MTERADAPRGGFVRVPMTRGYEALVDEADLHLVRDVIWHPLIRRGLVYAHGTIAGQQVSMHRFLMKAKAGQRVDHRNGDGLDNRRSTNLRFCTHAENMRNSSVNRTAGKASRYKGVTFRSTGRWAANIEQNGERVHLGTFPTEEQAARCYDAAAKVFHGKFARTNVDLGLLPPRDRIVDRAP